MHARACPDLRGWSGEQRDTIPAVEHLHPSGGCSGEHLASGITHRQDHSPQTVKEGAKQEGWGHHSSDSPKTGPGTNNFYENGLSGSAPKRIP